MDHLDRLESETTSIFPATFAAGADTFDGYTRKTFADVDRRVALYQRPLVLAAGGRSTP